VYLVNHFCKFLFQLPLIQAARNLLGRESWSDLDTFPRYTAVLFIMKASMLGMLQRRPLTSLFLICCSLTWCHLIASNLWITPW
jgi:hypothetical protein